MKLLKREQYNQLVSAYRDQPENHSHAARIAGVDRRSARRAYKQGYAGRPGMDWARPIHEVLRDEKVAARARSYEEDEQRLRALEIEHDKAREEAIQTLALEANILKLARGNLNVLFQLSGSLVPGLKLLTEKLKTAVEAGQVDAKQAMPILRQYGTIVRQGTTAAHMLIQAERLRKGDPTEVVEHRVENVGAEMTYEETLEELEQTKHILELAAGKGLVKTEARRPGTNGSGNGDGSGEVH